MSLSAEFARLHQLFKTGALTELEFQAAKAELLAAAQSALVQPISQSANQLGRVSSDSVSNSIAIVDSEFLQITGFSLDWLHKLERPQGSLGSRIATIFTGGITGFAAVALIWLIFGAGKMGIGMAAAAVLVCALVTFEAVQRSYRSQLTQYRHLEKLRHLAIDTQKFNQLVETIDHQRQLQAITGSGTADEQPIAQAMGLLRADLVRALKLERYLRDHQALQPAKLEPLASSLNAIEVLQFEAQMQQPDSAWMDLFEQVAQLAREVQTDAQPLHLPASPP